MRTVRYFPAGQHCQDALPGDLVLVRHTGLVAAAIRFVERLRRPRGVLGRFWDEYYCGWNHAAIVIDGDRISEEASRGDVFTLLSTYVALDYAVVHFDGRPQDQTDNVVKFAKSLLGSDYGYLTFVADLFNACTGMELSLGWHDHMVCSTASCRALERGDLIPDRSPYSVTPAHLAWYYDVPYQP